MDRSMNGMWKVVCSVGFFELTCFAKIHAELSALFWRQLEFEGAKARAVSFNVYGQSVAFGKVAVNVYPVALASTEVLGMRVLSVDD